MLTIQEVAESAYREWDSMNGTNSFRIWLQVAFRQEIEKILAEMARRHLDDCMKDINFYTLAQDYIAKDFVEKFDDVMKEEIKRQAENAVKESVNSQMRAEMSEIRAKAMSIARKSVKAVLDKMDDSGA